MPTHADVVEDMHGEAASRRNLQGNNSFQNLGGKAQEIIIMLQEQGADVSDKTMDLLKHIPVKVLAKVYEMQDKDPETILAWLKRRARKARAKNDPGVDDLKDQIKTGASRDPIAFFKDFEKENQRRIEEEQEAQEERDKLRSAKIAERQRKRDQQEKDMDAAKLAMKEDGQDFNAAEAMPDKQRAAIAAAFEKFANDASGFDNSNMDQDGEWWKKEPYRRDWERNKKNGKKWTAIIEGSKEPATETEQAVREEYYKSNDWWKADKFKDDWEATKENEWWKEEPYIQDWQQNKLDGTRWKAATEEAGLEGEAPQYPTTPDELKRREDWYKQNGPRGIVKRWNAATEGDVEKCSVPEKLEREEFYRNGDWWKGDPARLDFRDKGLGCNAFKFAKEDDAKDKDWWKQDPYREDFWGKGPEGKKWNALNEAAGIDGLGEKKPAPDLEQKKREEWYKDNWWKQKKLADDWKKKGKCWKAPNQKQADQKGGPDKSVGPEEQKKREEWYKDKMPDQDWWKAPEMVEDYHQNGPAGRHWGANTQGDGLAGKAQENPATPEEQQKRADWYKDNWFKQPKYVEEWAKNPNAAAAPGSAAWTCKNDEAGKDKDWWKQPEFIKNWKETQAPTTKPAGAEWWKQPEYLEDFQRHGDKGSRWTAAGESDGIAGKGGSAPASAPEKERRADWYKNNWWKAPQYGVDWAVKGPKGTKWKAAGKDAADDPSRAEKEPCSPDERREREQYFTPQGDAWRAVGEPEGYDKKAEEFPCSPLQALKRDEWYRNNWWKAPEYEEDWKKNGPKGTKWTAGNETAGEKGNGDKDPATDPEKKERENWYRTQGDIEWWKEPGFIEDWARNGEKGQMWPADNRVNAAKYGGQDQPAPEEEKAKREQWYKDNWWKTPQAMDDWKKRGKEGDHWQRKAAPGVQDRDPDTEGDGWWKQPAYIEDFLQHPDDGKCWTAKDPEAAATGQGKKKPATPEDKEKRAKWYMDNWWKAPSCSDDWNKNGAKGKDWLADTPTAARLHEGDKAPANDKEQKDREDWYKDRGDKDQWWKRPEFIEDHQDNGDKGKGWVAANPTAGALGQGHICPATAPEKEKRDEWYKDNWWKAPKYGQAWKKGDTAWAKETPGALKEAQGPEKKKRDDWFRANAGEPAVPEEQTKREDWYKKHQGEQSPQALAKREDWLKRQLPDGAKKKRMEWMKERAANDKRILADELPDALAGINEGAKPTDGQVDKVMDQIKKNRETARDDWLRKAGDGDKPDEPEEETIGQDEFLQAVADTNFYVAPDKEELDMQADDELARQQAQHAQRTEEELAYLAMEKEDELKATPEQWQKKAKVDVGDKDDWWKQPEFIENYQKNPEADGASAHWSKDPVTKQPVSPEDAAEREQWYKDNWWKSPEYSQQWRRDEMGDEGLGDGWKKTSKPPPEDPDREEDDPRPEEGMQETSPEEIADREKWYKDARAPERTYEDPTAAADEWWKKPGVIESYQDGNEEWKRSAQDGDAEVPPEEQEKREQWFKDNWWKAPKQIDEWKKKAKEDPEVAATSNWTRAAAPPPEAEDAPEQEEAAPAPAAAPEEIAEREAWYKQATKEEPVKPVVAPRTAAWGKTEDADEPFVGEKFYDKMVAQTAAWGKEAYVPEPAEPKEDEPAAPPATAAWTREMPAEDEPPVPRAAPPPEPEEEEEEEPFIGEKFYEQEAMPTMQQFDREVPDEEEEEEEPFVGEKFYGDDFQNEDDEEEEEEEPFVGEKFIDEMKDEDPRMLDDTEAEFEQAASEKSDEEDEDQKLWEVGDEDSDEDGEDDADSESDDEEDDNEHQDDEDFQADLEAAFYEDEESWEYDEEVEEAE